MNAIIINIGNELLNGHTINTNAAYIAQKLSEIGISVIETIVIADNEQAIVNAISNAYSIADLAICTGGLGPTTDDITKKAICQYFNVSLVFDELIWQHVQQLFAKLNINISYKNRSQAEIPYGATILTNKIGTAPGLVLTKEHFTFIALPGVPFEMKHLIDEEVLPYLIHQHKLIPPFTQTLMFTDISESLLAEKIEKWDKKLREHNIQIAYLPQPGIIKLKLFTPVLTAEQNIVIEDFICFVQEKLNDFLAYIGDMPFAKLIGELLIEKQATIATAESCTGGYIAHLLTSIPGSSAYFKGSIIAYSNDIKINILKVPTETISQYGAVSQAVVETMAKEILKNFNTDYAIAVSGIAGPDGGSAEKPIGTTWIAVASNNEILSQKFIFTSDRLRNIERASISALNMLRRLIK
ncbi:MAG: CinA family nicotinamide mononucleotide deamidase-related protein [Bacteroidales bacterium]|nr:CinA family nicotinamide mononucleotide deamidase-related protein [Bacteroidales bacterium]